MPGVIGGFEVGECGAAGDGDGVEEGFAFVFIVAEAPDGFVAVFPGYACGVRLPFAWKPSEVPPMVLLMLNFAVWPVID